MRPELPGGKIPRMMLDQILECFRGQDPETAVQDAFRIYWSPGQNNYYAHAPASGFHDGYAPNNHDRLVADIHSHGKMPAFFSEVDDHQSCENVFYGVVGCLHAQPDVRLSFIEVSRIDATRKIRHLIELETVFDYANRFIEEIVL